VLFKCSISRELTFFWLSSQDLTTNDGELNAARWRMRAASEQSARKFFFMLLLSLSYFIGEMVFGVLSGSLAVLADAFHMLTDVAALVCGYWVAQLSMRAKTAEHSFGWKRAEIVGALCNGCAVPCDLQSAPNVYPPAPSPRAPRQLAARSSQLADSSHKTPKDDIPLDFPRDGWLSP